jgi:hypothetical protein
MSLEPVISLLGIYPQKIIKHVQTLSYNAAIQCSFILMAKKVINKED